jgi:Concanavalin A-like lectin/glucanases superfamily
MTIYGITAQDEAVYVPPAALVATLVDNWNATGNGLTASSLAVADTPYLTLSAWLYSPTPPGLAHTFPEIFGMPGGSTWGHIGGNGSVNFQILNSSGSAGVMIASAASQMTDDGWHHLFVSLDANHAAGAKLMNLYLDGANIFDAGNSSDANAAFNIGVNGKAFGIPTNSAGLSGDSTRLAFYDVWIALGQYVDPSNISKFRTASGHPADLGTDGSTPTGLVPTFYFTGGAASFPTNRGSGPAMTLNGAFANYPGP